MSRRSVGREYESLAAAYLKKQGYTLLEKNFTCRQGEIDLIAREGEYLCFVEVKYRTTTHSGDPVEAVTPVKQARIIRTAQVYLLARGLGDDVKCRFDVIGITPGSVRLIRNAFALPW